MADKRDLILNISAILVALLIVVVLISNQPIFQGFHVLADDDTTAPTTTATAVKSDGSSYTFDTWSNSAYVSIALSCSDGSGNGCLVTQYCTDTTNSCTPSTNYSTPVQISTEGISYIRFNSTDTSRNSEEVKSQILKLDKSLPIVTITSPKQDQKITGMFFMINGTAFDGISNVSKVEVLINGMVHNADGSKKWENWQYNWQNFADGFYTITVNAKDNAGNVEKASVDVKVDNPPSAKVISLSDPPRVKIGTIEVKLQTSESVESPKLSYSFNGGTPISIGLDSVDGSLQTWKGEMIIKEGDDGKGTFTFSVNGENLVIQPSYFIVDAVKPPAVVSFNIEVEGDDAKLTWFYEGEKIKQFNIYRSQQANVGYAHYYKTVPAEATSTVDNLNGKTYYYRIAAVDLAGNIGPLSGEVSAASGGEQQSETQSQTTQTTTTQTLSIQLLAKIESSINMIDSEIYEIDKAKLILGRNSLSEELGLILQLNNAKATFNSFKEELNALKSGTSSTSSIENKIQEIDLKRLAILNNLPKDISLESESTFIQETTLKDIEEIADLMVYNLPAKERDSYITQNQRLQNRAEIKVTINHIRVILFEGEKKATLIKKEISSSLTNVSIVEVVPKTIAPSLSEITFITEGYEIIKEDPVVKWNGDIYEIKYFVEKEAQEGDLKQAKTLVLSDSVGGWGLFTGFAVAGKAIIDTVSNIKIITPIIILALLIIIYFVYFRDDNFVMLKGLNRRAIKDKEDKRNYRYNYNNYNYNNYYKTSENRFENNKVNSNIDFKRYIKPLSPPQVRQLQSIALMPKENFEEHFYEIAEKANQYANNGNFTLACKSYSLLVELYKRINVERKKRPYSELVHIYNKLNLYSKIEEIDVALRMNSGINLRSLLEHISEIYSVVVRTEGKDTALLRFAREYYEHAAFYLRRYGY